MLPRPNDLASVRIAKPDLGKGRYVDHCCHRRTEQRQGDQSTGGLSESEIEFEQGLFVDGLEEATMTQFS